MTPSRTQRRAVRCYRDLKVQNSEVTCGGVSPPRWVIQIAAQVKMPLIKRMRQRRVVRDQLDRADRTTRHHSVESTVVLLAYCWGSACADRRALIGLLCAET